MGFSALFGCFFAWTYHYRRLHSEPKGKPQRITETLNIPFEFVSAPEQERTAVKRLEQEKTSFEIDTSYKDAFVKKLLELFARRMEKESGVLSLNYWVFDNEGFTRRLSISTYLLSENSYVPKNNKYFSKKDFNWDGIDEPPTDIFESNQIISRSMMGAAISGDGKLRGYITIDNEKEEAFDDVKLKELKGLASFANETLQIMDVNFRRDRENNLLHAMLKDMSNLFRSVSRGNLFMNLSKILQDNFRFDRLMLITLNDRNKHNKIGKWYIFDAVGECNEGFKGTAFNVHEKCLLHDLLTGKTTTINEEKISIDPYQRRLFEREPENLKLRSLFAVMPPTQHNSYPVAIVLESKGNKAVSRIDAQMLTYIAACAAMKLSDIQEKMFALLKKESDLTDIELNGLGEILKYYEKEINSLKSSDDSLGILFIKCKMQSKENQASHFEKFLAALKSAKKAFNGRLSMLGNGEFIFTIKGTFSEELFGMTATQIKSFVKNLLVEDNLDVLSHGIWLNKNRVAEIETKYEQECNTMFNISVISKFKEMSGV